MVTHDDDMPRKPHGWPASASTYRARPYPLVQDVTEDHLLRAYWLLFYSSEGLKLGSFCALAHQRKITDIGDRVDAAASYAGECLLRKLRSLGFAKTGRGRWHAVVAPEDEA